MKYVEWVGHVLDVAVEANLSAPQGQLVGIRELAEQLNVPLAEASGDQIDGATWTAVQDLQDLGLLDAESIHWVRITQEARKTRHGGSLRDIWPSSVRIFLEPDQEQFLAKVVELAEEQHESWADVDFVEAAAVIAALGWQDDISVRYGMAAALEDERLARKRAFMGGFVSVRPTYVGVVRATEAARAEWHERIGRLVDRGETANVEFKRELHLETARGRAEFVRDVLALANTNVSGDRYLLIGFDPKTLAFSSSVDSAVTQDRIEDLLNAWTNPIPAVRFQRVDVPGGAAGVIEVFRDSAQLPYKPSRAFGKVLSPDYVFVRHGSHVERPSDQELEALIAEAERAADRR